jgi:AI-2 transport protein TqsA
VKEQLMDADQRERRIQTACLLILSAIGTATALVWLRPIMIPFVLAVFFAFGLAPLIDFQIQYLWVPRPLAIMATLVFGVMMLALMAGLITTSVAELAANADVYQTQIKRLLDDAASALPLKRFGVQIEGAIETLTQRMLQTVGKLLVGTTNAILGLLSQSLLVLVFLIFLLVGGTARTQPSGGILGEVEARIQRYLITKAIVSAATGVLVGLILSILGIDLALVFALFAFLLNFIPSAGSTVATLLPLPVVLVSPDISPTIAILAIVVPGVLQFVIGSVVEPKIMGGSLDLHPVVILLALILWGMIWGIVGMLLATPITAVMKILLEKMDVTAPVAELLAGRLDVLQSD